MLYTVSDMATKKLMLQFILGNIDFRKRSLYLQEVILLCKTDRVWAKALHSYFDTPYKVLQPKNICRN